MLTLTKAQVYKYKSIEDSTEISISQDITILVGKNESGKTAYLEALHKACPLNKGKNTAFDYVFDYPRKDLFDYEPKHKAEKYETVAKLTFSFGEEIATVINKEVFNNRAIISPEDTFTRTTHYGNGNSIGISIDQPKALEALKESLKGLEYTEQVFSNVENLEEVISNIEELELATDAKLAKFAKNWSARHSKAGKSWDYINWHIWNNYLSGSIPKFLYFSDYNLLVGKVNLDRLIQLKASNQLTEADETIIGLLDLSGISLEELSSDEGYENSKAKLEAIGLKITGQIFEYWRQNQDLEVEFDIKTDLKDSPPFNSGKNLYIRVKNRRHGVTVPFDQRSKGFIWFFSFMVWFSAVKKRAKTEDEIILLLDEPGLSLHALAQADFLNYIAALSKSHQIIYTTHSPFMINSERLDNVRVVEDRPKEGTKITENLEGSTNESLFPLQAALGYSIAQNLFISKKNVLIEGPADLIILQHFSSILEKEGKPGLAEGILVPVGGLDKLSTFIALLGANDLNIVVLHDRSSNSPQKLEDLIQNKLIERRKIFDYSMFREPPNQETDIEDLLPESLYIEAFNKAYNKELGENKLDSVGLGEHPRIVEKINQWLKLNNIALLKNGGFNHYRVAQVLLPLISKKKVDSEIIERFRNIFDKLNSTLN